MPDNHASLPDAGRTSHFEIDRLLKCLQGNATLPGDLVLGDGKAIYFLKAGNTAKESNGNWRVMVSGTDLVIQVRVTGAWTTEATFTP